jgi:hypothetical protein
LCFFTLFPPEPLALLCFNGPSHRMLLRRLISLGSRRCTFGTNRVPALARPQVFVQESAFIRPCGNRTVCIPRNGHGLLNWLGHSPVSVNSSYRGGNVHPSGLFRSPCSDGLVPQLKDMYSMTVWSASALNYCTKQQTQPTLRHAFQLQGGHWGCWRRWSGSLLAGSVSHSPKHIKVPELDT